ncbi:autotransporter domain-containing protein [bacterium]|nr:autotransporter domain-containing protein [bacterium]
MLSIFTDKKIEFRFKSFYHQIMLFIILQIFICTTPLIALTDVVIQDNAGAVAGNPVTTGSIDDSTIGTYLTGTGQLSILTDAGVGGSGDITHDAATSITWATAVNLIETAGRLISFATGASINSTGGGVYLNATNGGVGNFIGVDLINTTISTTSGIIAISGIGGDDNTTARHDGIYLNSGTTVSSTGVGAVGVIQLIGNSGQSSDLAAGVNLNHAGTAVTSVDANITIYGFSHGDPTKSNSPGIALETSTEVKSTGTGDMTLTGVGAIGVNWNRGVIIQQANVETNNGDLEITGTGGNSTGFSNYGISILQGSTVLNTAAGTGKLTIKGTAGSGTTDNVGVKIESNGSVISSDNLIEISGTGGNGTSDNYGIEVKDAGAVVTSKSEIQMTGVAGNCTVSNGIGIRVQNTGKIDSANGANITLVGTGKGTTTGNHGIMIDSAGEVSTNGVGNLTMTGIAGTQGDGIRLEGAGVVGATGSGNVTLNGTGAGTGSDIFFDTLAITKTGGTYTFNDTVKGTTLTVNAGAYNVSFNDGGTVTNDVTFANTGTVTLGNGNTDSFTFTGGLDTTACSTTTLAGTVATTDQQLDLGPSTLSADSTINSGTAAINLNTVNSSGNDLTVNSGSTLTLGNYTGGGALVLNIDTDDNEQLTLTLPSTLTVDSLAITGSAAGNEILEISALADSISLTGSNSLSINGNPVTITNIGTISGLNGNDTFTVGDGVSYTGNLDLGIGDDTLNFSYDTGSVSGTIDGGAGTDTLGLTSASNQTLDLSAFSNFESATLSGGNKWTLNGTTTMDVTVDNDTTLGGNSTIGNLTLNSTSSVAPGNSIGVTNVAGNVVFNAGSFYDVEVNAAGQSDQIIATGTGTLTGGTVRVAPETGNYAFSTTYTILSAAGGLGGTTFAGVTGTNTLFSYALNYVGNDVQLVASFVKTFFQDAITDNQKAVATVLDNAFQSGTETAASSTLLTEMIQRSGDTARIQLDDLLGVEHLYVSDAINRSSIRMKSLIEKRMSLTGRHGSPLKKEHGFWFKGFKVNGSSTDEHYGYDGNSFMGGFDFMLNKKIALGVFAGSSPLDLRSRDMHYSNDIETTRGGIYGNWRKGKLNLYGSFGFGNLDFNSSRNVSILGTIATGKWGGNEKFGNLEAGFQLIRNKSHNKVFMVELLGCLDYGNQEIDSFTETGAGLVNLVSVKRDLTSMRFGGGFRITAPMRWGHKGSIIPELKYRRMIENKDRDQVLNTFNFEGVRPAEKFTVSAADKEKTNDQIGVTVTFKNNSGTDIFVDYEYEGSSKRRQQSGSLGIKWAW